MLSFLENIENPQINTDILINYLDYWTIWRVDNKNAVPKFKQLCIKMINQIS